MSNLKEIKINDIEEFDSVEVVSILVSEGDHISIDQPLITIESEKAMMDFPSPYEGVIYKIAIEEGRQVKEGDTLAVIDVQHSVDVNEKESLIKAPDLEADTVSERKQDKLDSFTVENNIDKNLEAHNTRSIDISSPSTGYASPAVHEYARELGVDLTLVKGTGRQQRITKDDVQLFVKNSVSKKSNKSSSLSTKHDEGPLNFSSYGETKSVELTKIQKITAKNMQSSWQTIPHVTHFEQADVTLLEQHRKELSEKLAVKNIKLTPLTFVVKALVSTLKQFPKFNSSLDLLSSKLILKNYFHIGIAVDTPQGLLVPVMRDVDKMTVIQVAEEIVKLSQLARDRKLTPRHMSGASMTISSLGVLGGRAFTPIINPPEVAILGVSKMIIQENVTSDLTAQKKLLPLSLSYDHRVINGADAARFSSYLKDVLEDIWKLIL